MRASVLIVHHNAPDHLRRCLAALPAAAAGAAWEAVVVDNDSERLDPLPREFPGARWIVNRENVGFGRAVNQAAAEARGDLLVLVNQDAEPLPGSIASLRRFFLDHAAAPLGPVGGRLLSPNGGEQPSCGPFPTLANVVGRLPLPRENRRHYWRLPERRGPAGSIVVDWVSGAFLAVRRDVFEALGGFDPRFFLYYEDADFCLRAARAGRPACLWPPSAAVHHDPCARRERLSPALKRIIQRSRSSYFEKNRPAWESWVLERLHGFEPVH